MTVDWSLPGSPLRYSKRNQFECTVTLPAKDVKQPKSRKTKPKAKKSSKAKRSPRAPTPVELQERQERRREYEKNRNQRPERKQYAREREKNKRQRAKELGLCRTCSQPAISNQTRCPSCAAKHRRGNATITAKRRAAKSKDQQTCASRNPSP